MAQIRIHEVNTALKMKWKYVNFYKRKVFYMRNGIFLNFLPHLNENYSLTDENKAEILAVFSKEIADVSARRGYKAHDVISLSNSTPNLDELLINFQKEHHHTDDEVRFIVSGHGIFAIEGKRWDIL